MANPGPATTVTPHLLIGGDSTDGTAIGINGGPVGFFGATPAVQQGAAGNTTTTAAGSTTAASARSALGLAIGTDVLAPPSGTSILKANSGGALANATAGTDYVAPGTATVRPLCVSS